MLTANMKICIVMIIVSTVSCKMAKNHDDHAEFLLAEETKRNAPPLPTSCTRCGTDPSISLSQAARVINEQHYYGDISNYVRNRSTVIRNIRQTTNEVQVEIPVRPRCIPTPQVISLIDDGDAWQNYMTPCIRVNRCSGCCQEEKHSCQPTETRLRKFEVLKVSAVFTSVVKLIEEHTKCQCNCRVKRDSCTERQVYDANECRCDCRETEEKKNCLEDVLKSWDHNDCKCTCAPEVSRDCNTPLEFDENTCTCKE